MLSVEDDGAGDGRSGFAFAVYETATLPDAVRDELSMLFEVAYRQANQAYLAKSLRTLRYVAVARQGSRAVGFALGEQRVLDLPGLPRQAVRLAGMCCIAPEYRRRGLFGKLESLALGAAKIEPQDRWLTCGRMAHPASMRGMARNPTVVPKPGVPPTPWQREVGEAIARAYGVSTFDPATFVCVGDGTPIGYPNLEVEATPEEWEVFRPVNRDRGDALLALAWNPDAPPGW